MDNLGITGRKFINGKNVIVDKEKYREYHKMQRIKNREKYREYNREYNKNWRALNGYHNERNSTKRYPEKEAARRLARRAVRLGLLERKPCEVCGKSGNIQMHHTDYTKPLEVIFLCPAHHSLVEKRAAEY